ncbi:MAG: flippase-like domain-containing protein [Actinobacteria bacterium]|nr:flippase-like domain-containing protein [Actinomycetota bacterium]
MLLSRFRGHILLSLALGLVVVVGMGMYADVSHLTGILSRFQWELLPVILTLTLVNYLFRFGKWHYYLHVLNSRGLGWPKSLAIFLGGFSMTVTPGKVGEWLKSFLLKDAVGMPISTSAPVIVAERLTDGLAMLILASGGLLLYGYGQGVMLAILLGCLAFIVLVQQRWFAERAFRLLERAPFVAPRVHHLRAFYESAHELLRARNLLLAVSVGVVSWIWECVAFYLVLVGLGLAPTPALFLQATFILSSSSLLGGASMVPGGLAVAEGSIAGTLLILGTVNEPAAAMAAALLIRLSTLWFGVAIGIVTLFGISRTTHARQAEV